MTRFLDASVLVLATVLAGSVPVAARAQGPAGGELSIDSARITGQVEIPPGPEYLGDAVFYQVYPQTFLDTNADGCRSTTPTSSPSRRS
jgi:hypothetical protein